MPARDPREIITPDAFSVAQELLGLPLATPWRRGVALAVDGLLVAILSGAPSVFLGFAAAGFLFRISSPAPGTSFIRRSLRLALRSGGAIVLFTSVVWAWGAFSGPPEMDDGLDADDDVVAVAGLEGVRTLVDVARLERAESDEQAVEIASAMVDRLDLELRAKLREALRAESSSPEATEPRTLRALRAALGPPSAAADSIAELEDELADVEEELAETEAELRRARDRGGVLAFFRSLAEDIGLELGWAAIYFTLFPTLWDGRTPGKKLLGIRVVRLTGKPIGWWFSFERFGGYAAGVATGLLGFAQMFWDANRQGVHDKIAETVVVRERREPAGDASRDDAGREDAGRARNGRTAGADTVGG